MRLTSTVGNIALSILCASSLGSGCLGSRNGHASCPLGVARIGSKKVLTRALHLRGGAQGLRHSPLLTTNKLDQVVVGEKVGGIVESARGGTQHKRVSIRWPMLSAFLYFLSMAFTIPVIPKVINTLLSDSGNSKATATSAATYGLVASVDSSFTFLSVNFHATLSDTFGRRPFMALSTMGLGLGFLITYFSRNLLMLVIAAAIDGCTSCMYSIAHASINDCVGEGPGLSEAFGVFQGISLGTAFMIGLPLGGILGSKFGLYFPLKISMALCALNLLVVTLIMPESLSKEERKQKIDLSKANPMGAIKMALHNKLVTGVTMCWALLWIAHSGLQINWINYTDLKLNWSVAQSGASLTLLGLLVAVFPKLVIPRLGLERSITYGLFVYAISQTLIASAPGEGTRGASLGFPMVVGALILAAAGTVAFPATLAYLSHQVGEEERGAVQGSADTVKTLCNMFGSPFMSWFFAFFISEKAWPCKVSGASYYLGAVLAIAAWVSALLTFRNHGHKNLMPGPGDKGFNFEGMDI